MATGKCGPVNLGRRDIRQTMITLGLDIGGTYMRAGVVDETGCVLSRLLEPTVPETSFESALGRIAALCEAVVCRPGGMDDRHFRETPVVGLAVAGIVDRAGGTVRRCVNMPWLEGRSLRDELQERLTCPVSIFTDIEAATWAEYSATAPGRRKLLGVSAALSTGRGDPPESPSTRTMPKGTDESGKPPDPFVHLRIGTGIGCGLIDGGRIVELKRTGLSHLDLLVVDREPEAPECPCGLRGCLEVFASGRAVDRRARAAGLSGGTGKLATAARRGEMRAERILSDVAGRVAKALDRLSQELGPRIICMGGGVAEAIPDLLERVCSRVTCTKTDRQARSLWIVRASLGDDAGVIGAALLARRTGE